MIDEASSLQVFAISYETPEAKNKRRILSTILAVLSAQTPELVSCKLWEFLHLGDYQDG